MNRNHYVIGDRDTGSLASRLDAISLQNVNDRYFVIDSEILTQPTYVELKPGPSCMNVFVKTRRPMLSTKRDHNLEPRLAKVLDDFGVFD